MPIDPRALAGPRLSGAWAAEHDLARAMPADLQQRGAGVDRAGLMLADERGGCAGATASDQQTQVVGEGEERLGRGPCVDAFAEHAPMAMRMRPKSRSGARSPTWSPARRCGPVSSVPVQLEGGRSAWTCIRLSETGWAEIGAAQVYGPGRDAAQPGRCRPGQGAAGRPVAGGLWACVIASSGPRAC